MTWLSAFQILLYGNRCLAQCRSVNLTKASMSVIGLARVIAPYERQLPIEPDSGRARQAESKLKGILPTQY